MHHSLTNQTLELFRNKVTGFYVAEVQARMMLKMPSTAEALNSQKGYKSYFQSRAPGPSAESFSSHVMKRARSAHWQQCGLSVVWLFNNILEYFNNWYIVQVCMCQLNVNLYVVSYIFKEVNRIIRETSLSSN